MGKIILVAESGSDISKELRERYGIRIVPMHVIFGDVTKDDGTFSPSEVIDYYRKTKKIPSTSGRRSFHRCRSRRSIRACFPTAIILL